MKIEKGKCFFNGVYLGEGELSIVDNTPESPFTKFESVFEPLSDDELEEKKVCFKEHFYQIKKHSLDNQSFKFPIINPEYILVKKEYNLLKTKFGKECIKNAAQNLSDSIDNYLLEIFKTGSYPYIDKRKDIKGEKNK